MNRERSSDGTNDDFQTKKKRILWGISTSTKRLKLQQQQQKNLVHAMAITYWLNAISVAHIQT